MPISPTGSSKSPAWRGQQHELGGPSHAASTSTTTSSDGSPAQTQPTFQDHPLPWELYESASYSPRSAIVSGATSSPSKFTFQFSAAPLEPTDTTAAAKDGEGFKKPSVPGLHLTTTSGSSTAASQGPPHSPLSTGSASSGSNGLPSATASTPPTTVRSPGQGGGFFASFRPSSPRIPTEAATGSGSPSDQQKRNKERAPSSSNMEKDKSSASLRSDRGMDSRLHRPSSVFGNFGHVLDRFGKKSHTRSESREPAKGIASGSNSSATTTAAQTGAASSSRAGGVGGAATPAQEQVEYLDSKALLDKPPSLARNPSHSSAVSAYSTNDDFAVLSRKPALERTLIQVTEDNERFSVVDVSGLNSAAGIKERMLSKLHRYQDEPSFFTVYRTEIGQSDASGSIVGDDGLLALCLQSGDDRGNLKFLLKQIGPPASPGSAIPPPPASVLQPPIRRGTTDSHLADSPRSPSVGLSGASVGSATNPSGSTSYRLASNSSHAKSDSLSSLSSTGDALFGLEATAAILSYESGSEAGKRTSGGGLARAKGVSRRSFASGSGDDTRQSIISNSTGGGSSRPNSGLVPVREDRTGSSQTQSPRQPYRSAAATDHDGYDEPRRASDPAAQQASLSMTAGGTEEMEELHSIQDNAYKSVRRYSRSIPQRPATSQGVTNSATRLVRRDSSGKHEEGRGRRGSSASSRDLDQSGDEQGGTYRQPARVTPSHGSGALDTTPRQLQAGNGGLYGSHDAARMYAQSTEVPARTEVAAAKRSPEQAMPSLQLTRSVDDMRSRSEAAISPTSKGIGQGSARSSAANGSKRDALALLTEELALDGGSSRYPKATLSPQQSTPAGPSMQAPRPRRKSSDFEVPARTGPTSAPLLPVRSMYSSSNPARHNEPPPPPLPFQMPASSSSAIDARGRQQGPPLTRPATTGPVAVRPSPMRGVSPAEGFHRPSPSPAVHGPSDYTYGRSPPGPPAGFMTPSRPSAYPTNDFGVAANHGDPRLAHSQGFQRVVPSTGAAPPAMYGQRPHTFYDGGAHVYRPRPMEPPENPYTQALFPASSSRQVAEFQRTGQMGVASLSPGMTIQETLQKQQHRHPQHGGHGFGPREPRSSGSSHQQQQWDPRAQQHSAPPQRTSWEYQQQSGHRTAPIPAHRPAPPAHVVPGLDHRYPQQQLYSPQSQPVQHRGTAGFAPQTSPSVQPRQFQGHHGPSVAAQYHPLPLQPGALPTPSSSTSATQGPQQSPQRSTRPPGGGSTSDRSSGSSFASAGRDSHHRDHSREVEMSSSYRRSAEGTATAPSSARSSRSGPPLSPEVARNNKQQQHHDGRSRTLSDSRGGDQDIDLSSIRPLPRLPPSGSGGAATTTKREVHQSPEDEGTLKAAQWASLLGRAAESGSGDAARNARPAASGSAAVKAPSGNAKPSTISLADDADGGGTFASFASFADDDDDDEGGTWARPLDAIPAKVQSKSDGFSPKKERAETELLSGDEESGTLRPSLRPVATAGSSSASRKLSPRRPELRLTIDQPSSSGSPIVEETSRATRTGPRPSPGSASTDTALQALSANFSPGVHRKSSFARRDNDWAMRPPPEQLYERLDDFFPKHDLDKPVLDASSNPAASLGVTGSGTVADQRRSSSRQGGDSPASAGGGGGGGAIGQSPTSPASASSLTRHKKSIRRVAEDRMRFMERHDGESASGSYESTSTRRRSMLGAGGLAPLTVMSRIESDDGEGHGSADSNLARKRSTKLWGTKLLEMTPGSEQTASTTGAAESPSADKPIFKWVKGDLIGKGTYGRVYLALNATTGEMIAVKQVELPRTESDRQDSRQKGVVAALKSEIDTLKDLDHPNIVSYLGFEETPRYLHLFLEYVPGGSIASVLRKYGPIEEGTIKFFVFQILSGLTHLHERGVLHRDLKGDNLLVTLDGTVKISDFGTVRRSENIYDNVEGMSLQGSVFWMAPEVVTLNKKGYSAKVDIWSLGCVVLEMLAGRRPWSDEEAVQAMFKIGSQGKAPPIPPDVRPSPEAAHFLRKCFELDPEKRPTSARLLQHVFPYVADDWTFESTRLYETMSNTLKNR